MVLPSPQGVWYNGTTKADNIDFTGNTVATAQVTQNGQLIIGSSVSPQIRVNTLTAGTGISIINGAGSITINAIGGGLTWHDISANQTLVVNNGYICQGGATLSLALPSTSSVGNIIQILLDGSTNFTITQGAGQQIRYGNISTTSGASGSISSNQQGDMIKIICQIANTKWNVLSSIGALSVV